MTAPLTAEHVHEHGSDAHAATATVHVSRAGALARSLLLMLPCLWLPSVSRGAQPSSPPALSRMEKMARILELEDRRRLGGGEIERLLADADRGVRRRAAQAAGRIGSPELLPALIDRMNDSEAEVRQMAAFALGLTGDTRAGERLLLALQDPAAVVRARAAEALGRAGGTRTK